MMAAATLGNVISDLCGLDLAHIVKLGLISPSAPALLKAQLASGQARWAANLGRSVGLIISCLVSMFPLLFFDEEETIKAKHSEEEEKKSTE